MAEILCISWHDGTQVCHYTYLADGIVTAMEHPGALNEDFNLSTAESTNVLELARAIWVAIKGTEVPFNWVSDPPFEHDVKRLVPSTEKAKRIQGFEATITLDDPPRCGAMDRESSRRRNHLTSGHRRGTG